MSELAVFDDSGSAVKKGNSHNKRHKNHRIIGVIFFLIITGVSTYFIYRSTTNKSTTQCNGRENSKIYKDTAMLLGPGVSGQLGRAVEKIKLEPRFDEDPSCLYLVTTYYLNISDIDNATKYFTLFDKKVNQNKKVVSFLGDAKSLDNSLKTRITILQKSIKNLDANRRFYD